MSKITIKPDVLKAVLPDMPLAGVLGDNSELRERVTRFVNDEIRRQVEQAPVVLRLKNGLIVSENPVPGKEVKFTGQVAATHRGRLVCIEQVAEEKP